MNSAANFWSDSKADFSLPSANPAFNASAGRWDDLTEALRFLPATLMPGNLDAVIYPHVHWVGHAEIVNVTAITNAVYLSSSDQLLRNRSEQLAEALVTWGRSEEPDMPEPDPQAASEQLATLLTSGVTARETDVSAWYAAHNDDWD